VSGPRALPASGVSPELRRHYDAYYAGGASEWRRLGALAKAENVLALCAGEPHASVVEVGAGEGALLARLAELGFAERLYAVELSRSGARAIGARGLRTLAAPVCFDGATLPFADASFDLAVLSHVLEHAEHPRRLLAEAARVARLVFVEVPLEDTWRLPRDYAPDPVGHINYFSPASLRRLVQTCGLAVLAERVALPSRAAVVWRSGPRGALAHALKRALLGAAPALATRAFTYHGALLCRRVAKQTAS
jgi:SAM-dependent methyltransferase